MFGLVSRKMLVDALDRNDELLKGNATLLDQLKALRGGMKKRAASGEMDAAALGLAMAVPESNVLLRAILQVMDGQREELMQDAAEQGIDPSESMARSRGADALRQSADEIWQLVKQANAARAEGVVSEDSDESMD